MVLESGQQTVFDPEEENRKRTIGGITRALGSLVMDTPGVYRVTGMAIPGQGKVRKDKTPTKGIRVSIKEEGLLVNIHVAVTFGRPIPEIARVIQNAAKDMLQRDYPAYGLIAVNVSVNSVHFDQDSFIYREEAITAMLDDAPQEQEAICG